MGYINPKDFFDATELRAIVCTSSEGDRFVEFYDRLNEANTVLSFPAVFSRDNIHDGNVNPYIFMLEEYEPKRYRVINRDFIGMPIIQSVEEYTGLDETCCVVNKNYIYIYCDWCFIKRVKLKHSLDEVSLGIVDNKYITIVIDDSETFADFNDYKYFRDLCVCEIYDKSYDFTGEFDEYYNECDNAEAAYMTVYEEFINK